MHIDMALTVLHSCYVKIKGARHSEPSMVIMIQQCITTTRVHGDNYCLLFGRQCCSPHGGWPSDVRLLLGSDRGRSIRFMGGFYTRNY